jgi:hypothetical protein
MKSIAQSVRDDVEEGRPIRANRQYEVVRSATLEDGRSPLEGMAELVVALWQADRQLEALQATRDLESFLRDCRQEMVDELRRPPQPVPWSEIASALGTSKQAASQRYGGQLDEPALPVRPGPMSEGRRSFQCTVNPSFLKTNSPITLPRDLNEWASEHLLADDKGASIALMIEGPDGTAVAGRLRYSETRGRGYYQLSAPRGSFGVRLGERLEVTVERTGDGAARVRLRNVWGIR